MANQRGIVAGWDENEGRPKGVTTAADLRASLSGICADEGIFWQPDWEPTRSETSMVVGLPAFTCAIESSLGGYYCPTIEPTNLQLPVGHTSYDRYVTFWVKQWDYQTDASHPDSEVETGVATGTPASVPAKPSIPAGALAAVTVLIPKGAMSASEIPAENIQPYWTMSPAAAATNHTVSKDKPARVDETLPTYLAADAAALAAIKTAHAPSGKRPVRAYDQAARQFKICLGGAWLNEDDIIVVSGVAYQRGGIVAGSWRTGTTPSGGVYYKYYRLTLPVPSPPSGWKYQVELAKGIAITWMNQINGEGNWVDFHVFGVADNAEVTRLHWQLVKA